MAEDFLSLELAENLIIFWYVLLDLRSEGFMEFVYGIFWFLEFCTLKPKSD